MANVKLFFDTEFTDLKKDCDLISIGVCAYIEGLVDDDGSPSIPCFYAESMDFAEEKCSDFVRENVLSRLLMAGKFGAMHEEHMDSHNNRSVIMYGVEQDIGMALRDWINQFMKYNNEGKIEVWSDCLAYDWVLFCDILNPFPNDIIYYIPFDLSTLLRREGIDPDITRETLAKSQYRDQIAKMEQSLPKGSKHNSLFDAMIIYFCWKIIWKGEDLYNGRDSIND